MPRLAIRNPHFVIVVCLIVAVVGVTSLARMPVDLFPAINIPEVVVATFYNGMPPEDIETEITGRFERFFTLGSGIDHIESRSLPGVSIIKIFFQPGTDADSDVTMISNLAMANLRRLPPGTLPPVVLRFGGSSLPVCLVTLAGSGLTETQLRDLGQFAVRNQLATVPGASVPPPFGGRYRQIMVYADPLKLQAYHLSLMDVVRAVNDSNLILPAGDAKIGPFDYNIYTNSQIQNVADINRVPVKTVEARSVTIGDIGHAQDAHQIQTNVVRVNGQRSVYLPILKQGGNTNTLQVVDSIRAVTEHLFDVPAQLRANLAFDQSLFVKSAIRAVLLGAALGLVLTCLLVLVFLSSARATLAVLLSAPIPVLATFVALEFAGGSVNTMILAGLALAFSRLIFNAIVVLENIVRHLEMGEPPDLAAELGGEEVSRPVLAATLATAVVFFPVTFLYGVSRFLFSALALAVVLALAASYAVALTVVPLFCARLLRPRARVPAQPRAGSPSSAVSSASTAAAEWCRRGVALILEAYARQLDRALRRPVAVIVALLLICAASFGLYPMLGVAFFPRTDAAQFLINFKAPSGTRIEVTEDLAKRIEGIVHQVVTSSDLGMIVSNLGVTPDFSSIYTSNAGAHTGTIQVSLAARHRIGSYEYMDRLRRKIAAELPDVRTFFQSGGLQDAILNMGLPAPIDVQISGNDQEAVYRAAGRMADRIRGVPGVSESFIPQDMDYPALRLNIDRQHASELGLSQREVVNNVITALTSNGMIAPSYWIDPRSGNDYLLTVQYPEAEIHTLTDLKQIPLRSPGRADATTLDVLSDFARLESPTEVDHYQIQRVMDVYVTPSGEDLGRVADAIGRIIGDSQLPPGARIHLRGMVEAMRSSFRSFGLGLCLAVVILYLILVAPFRSLSKPLLILLAVPPGLSGIVVTLNLAGSTLNVMSLMGTVMLVGVAVSNSILIAEYADRLQEEGLPVREAIVDACRIRFRPVLMTSLATIVGLIPMALRIGTGSEVYAPLALAIIGGLSVSFVSTLFIVPAAYVVMYRGQRGGESASSPGDGS